MGETSQTQEVVRKFVLLTMFNSILAFIFTIPILIPNLCIATPPGEFGCIESMETSWPGTWLLVAYLLFIMVGVIGCLAWATTYYFRGSVFGRTSVSGKSVWLQVILFEMGVLGVTGMMAAIGYVGGNVVAHGGSAAVAAEAVATQIIPPLSNDPTSFLNDMPPVVEAIFIGLSALAQLIGIANLFAQKTEPSMA